MGCEPDLFLGYKGRFVGSDGPARLTLDHFIRAECLTHILPDVVVERDAPEHVFLLHLTSAAQIFGVLHGLIGRVR